MSLVYLPTDDYKNIGGPTTFIKNLAKYFNDQGVDFTSEDHQQAQSILFPISYKTSQLKQYKKEKKPIIQRLDGIVGFPWQNPRGIKTFFTKMRYEDSNLSFKRRVKFILDTIQINNIYRNYTDLVIFQSQYCRDLCFDMIGPLNEDRYRIIYNGVHTDIYYPDENRELPSKPIITMTGRYRRNDMLLPVFDALDSLKEKYDFSLKVIGPIEGKIMLEEAQARDYVQYCGPMNSSEIASELRNSDLYIFSSLNAPCPNALLEAVTTGLPVVSYDYGSTSELLRFNPDLIAQTKESKNPFLKSGKHLSSEGLAEKIELCLTNYEHHRKVALANARLYSFEQCGDAYLEAIKSQLNS